MLWFWWQEVEKQNNILRKVVVTLLRERWITILPMVADVCGGKSRKAKPPFERLLRNDGKSTIIFVT